MYYDKYDYVTNRTSADIELIKQVKKRIAQVGWGNLTEDEQEIYMTTRKHHLGLRYGAKGCINTSDLNRYLWGCCYAIKLYRDNYDRFVARCIEKGVDPSTLPFSSTTTFYCDGLFEDVNSPTIFVWRMGVIPYGTTSEDYDMNKLSDDLKRVLSLDKDYFVHNVSVPDNIFNGISLNELNGIDLILSDYATVIERLYESIGENV